MINHVFISFSTYNTEIQYMYILGAYLAVFVYSRYAESLILQLVTIIIQISALFFIGIMSMEELAL